MIVSLGQPEQDKDSLSCLGLIIDMTTRPDSTLATHVEIQPMLLEQVSPQRSTIEVLARPLNEIDLSLYLNPTSTEPSKRLSLCAQYHLVPLKINLDEAD